MSDGCTWYHDARYQIRDYYLRWQNAVHNLGCPVVLRKTLFWDFSLTVCIFCAILNVVIVICAKTIAHLLVFVVVWESLSIVKRISEDYLMVFIVVWGCFCLLRSVWVWASLSIVVCDPKTETKAYIMNTTLNRLGFGVLAVGTAIFYSAFSVIAFAD